jgi:anhydro-N-acetylmuramic acid kinase
LCELTARSIADGVAQHAKGTQRLLVCGGGALNTFLLERLRALTRATVETTQALDLAPLAVEAAAFAWLAMRTLKGLPGNIPAVTGARKAAVLGGIYQA